MALDTRLSLTTQPVDVKSQIAGGLANREQYRTAGIREEILKQNVQLNQQSIDEQKKANAAETLKYTSGVFKGLRDLPLTERAKILAQQAPALEQLGIPRQQLLSTDLTNEGLDNGIKMLDSLLSKQQTAAPTSAISNFQYFNSVLADPSATEDQRRAARIALGTEASAGRAQVKEVSPGVYQTFDPNSNAFGNPFKYGPNGEQLPLTRSEQQGLRLGEDVAAIETKGAAQTGVDVVKAEQLAEVELSTAEQRALTQARITRANQLKAQYSDQARQAAAAVVPLTEALKLAQTADQGVSGVGKLYLSKLFPNIDVTDEAALDSALLSLSLDQLQKFKGPTTDFEFGVVQNISGKLLGSAKANQARIAALQRANWFKQKEADQFNSWVDNGNDPDRFTFNFTEMVNTGKGEYTLKDIQDTAVHYGISIEQVLENLK